MWTITQAGKKVITVHDERVLGAMTTAVIDNLCSVGESITVTYEGEK